jgi:hypothetical protein
MRSVFVFFGLLSAFMLVSSLPLGPATLEKRVGIDIAGTVIETPSI